MEVRVDDSGPDGPVQLDELAGGDSLGVGSGTDVAGGNGAADRGGGVPRPGRRAALGADGAIAEVGAEEDHDAAVDAGLGKVKVSLGDSRRDVEVAQLPV